MAVATVEAQGGVVRLLVLRLPEHGRTIVLKVAQSRSEFEASRQPAATHQLQAVPPYPGSRPLFFAHDRNTDASFELSRATASPMTVRDFFASQLPASGWKPALRERSSMGVYVRQDRLALVLATQESHSSHTRIAVLHKTLK
jgi:hypothetical protein